MILLGDADIEDAAARVRWGGASTPDRPALRLLCPSAAVDSFAKAAWKVVLASSGDTEDE
jgi:hypothetical protein